MPTASRANTFYCLALCFGLTGCLNLPDTTPPTEPPPRTFVTVPGYISSMEGPWVLDSPEPLTQNELSYVSIDGVRAIVLRGNELPYVVAQDVDANLFLTPYMRWLWHMDDPGESEHPVRLVLGFSSGQTAVEDAKASINLAPHNRTIVIGWGTSALQRGTFFPPDGNRSVPKYIMRGGGEQAYQWQQDTVDLASLYRRAWPADDFNRVRLRFIGFAVEGAKSDAAARFSGIDLMR